MMPFCFGEPKLPHQPIYPKVVSVKSTIPSEAENPMVSKVLCRAASPFHFQLSRRCLVQTVSTHIGLSCKEVSDGKLVKSIIPTQELLTTWHITHRELCWPHLAL